jgi:signal transduction histidine kinase
MYLGKGTRTRVMLVAPLVLVIAVVTASSLLIVRNRLRVQISENLSADLTHSVDTFQSIEAQRLDVLDRENALLSNLPSLKALMTTSDERTIADGSIQFWQVSGNDLFALATKDYHVVAAYARGIPATPTLRADIADAIGLPGRHYLLSESRLFVYSVRPLYFGSEDTGTLLGYVISGDAINNAFVQQISHASSVHAAFLSGNRVIVSTLSASLQSSLAQNAPALSTRKPRVVAATLAGEHFLTSTEDLSPTASAPLHLLVLKSFDQAERAMKQINQLVLTAGLIAIIAGIILMLALSRAVTRPLELLAEGVRAFGTGDAAHSLPQDGTLEVRELSVSFAAMRDQINETNNALLEAERLATIGRMASSVSHDIRHYLATIYANSEFLVNGRLSSPDRAEILGDIRMAVHGTTDLLDSMLIFSRSGNAVRRSHELVATLLERTMALVRTHPDANEITLTAEYGDPVDTGALVDARQIERAIYNLLLNACQSSNARGETRKVRSFLKTTEDEITLLVMDDGPGVPDSIRDSLFEPFVSEGKQKGTGLGLTLVNSIATEHGGSAQLLSSRPEETIFCMTILRKPRSTPTDKNTLESGVATE